MAYENIIFETDENVAIIKFNRPKALNAVNTDVLAELADALDKVGNDTDIRALVLSGASSTGRRTSSGRTVTERSTRSR